MFPAEPLMGIHSNLPVRLREELPWLYIQSGWIRLLFSYLFPGQTDLLLC